MVSSAPELEQVAAVGGYIETVLKGPAVALAHVYTAGRMVVGLFGREVTQGLFDFTGVTHRTAIIPRKRSFGLIHEALGVGGDGLEMFLSLDVYNDETTGAMWKQGIFASAYQLSPYGNQVRQGGSSASPLKDGYNSERIYSIGRFQDRHPIYDDAVNMLISVRTHLEANAAEVGIERTILAGPQKIWQKKWQQWGAPVAHHNFASTAIINDRRAGPSAIAVGRR